MVSTVRALGLALPPLLLAGIVVNVSSGDAVPVTPPAAAPAVVPTDPRPSSQPRREPTVVAPDSHRGPHEAEWVGERQPVPKPDLPRLDVEGLRSFRRSFEGFVHGVPPESQDLLMEALANRIDAAHTPVRRQGASPLDQIRQAFDIAEQLDGLDPKQVLLEYAEGQLGRPVAMESLSEVAASIGESRRSNANESAAIATLKNISSAQAQCQASGVIDANRNGAGEYGCFAELAGKLPVRGDTTERITPPVLSAAFAKVDRQVVVRSGYVFQMWLPQHPGGLFVAENPDGGVDARMVDHALCEVIWRCYAWPLEAGKTGDRAFVVDQSGDVLGTQNAAGRWSGVGNGPRADAASGTAEWTLSANQIAPASGESWVVIS